jgi:D-alanine-D-alanine ligase
MTKPRLKVTMLVDSASVPKDDPVFAVQPDTPVTEFHVASTLRQLNHEVRILTVTDSVQSLSEQLASDHSDIVFNLTEEFRGDRRMDQNIAALLELMSIPFTGAGSIGLQLCRAKGLCKQLLSLHKIRVPGFVTIHPGDRIRIPKTIRFPLVVKPVYEDGSDGISNASLVKDENQLRERAAMVHERWKQPAIAEEYIEGRELYVGLIGNKRIRALPPREWFVGNGNGGNDGPVLATYRVKWDKEYQQKWNISFGFAELSEKILRDIDRTCKKVYRILQMRDYGRIDLRLTPENRLVILEANANPDIGYGDELSEAAAKAGIKYEALIEGILRHAMDRYRK